MSDQFDVSLEDDDLMYEVELTASLMVAANQSDRHLTPDEVDDVLGVQRRMATSGEHAVPRQRMGSDQPHLVRE